ncbi:MAG: FHA domain-containing protein [Deltaproteobacteria bacterium]|nr:FHA domain-containing protein [Deltaproteobacteria bacterium]
MERGTYLIGRSSKEEIRERPDLFYRLPQWARRLIESARHSITIQMPDRSPEQAYISRAQLWLEAGEGSARIADLGSKNSTYVNGVRLQSNGDNYEIRTVYPDDVVSIGAGAANIRYRALPRARYSNHALFVGWGETEEDLEMVANNVDAIKKEAALRGFAGNMDVLTGLEARKKDILSALERMASRVQEDSLLLFYFVGWTGGGRNLKLRVEDGQISARELFALLMGSWCQKLFILEGPRTSALARIEMPPRSVLIGNREEAGEGGIKSRNGETMRYLTRAICKALEGRDAIDIHALVQAVERDSLIHSARQEVACHRKTWILLPGEMGGAAPA